MLTGTSQNNACVKKSLFLNLSLLGLLVCSLFPVWGQEERDLLISLDTPSAPVDGTPDKLGWFWANPIGNGRLGGMVYGGVEMERIHINEDTFWSGEPRRYQKEDASEALPKVRELLKEGKTAEAQQLMESRWLGPYNECYMPMTDLILRFQESGAFTDYRRDLDLKEGIVKISYKRNGVTYTREVFSSYPDQAIVMRFTADKKGALNFDASLESQQQIVETKAESNSLIQTGEAPTHASPHYLGVVPPVYEKGKAMRFASRLMVNNEGGTVESGEGKVKVRGADSVTMTLVAATSFAGFDKNPATEGKDEKALCETYAQKLVPKNYETLRQAHVSDYKSLFDRVSLDLGGSPEEKLPIPQRIGGHYKPEKDPALTALYFQFARYLTISSSRQGSQPTTLQGIWNKDMQPAWSCNYTLNCNAEIVYWGVEAVNLSECHLPLIEMVREASVDGERTAKALYGVDKGWMAHHNLDLWRTTWPVGGSGSWALFQTGGAWLCHHLWEHYAYTLDKEYLKKYYPTLKGAAEFVMEYLVEDKDGFLVTSPSVSFEHGFVKEDGNGGWACMGAAQDMQIIRTLLENTISAANVLGDEPTFVSRAKKTLDRLAKPKISPTTGQLQEWNDDWQPANPHDGQIGHGWGLGVGSVITRRKTPELAEAFRKCIDYRNPDVGWNSGSWTGAFPINFRVRLGEGDKAQAVLDRHFTHAVANNLCSHFSGYWEIDGNLGMEAGIVQMFLQSHSGDIELLPALPSKYPTGKVKGLRAKGACTVDIEWENSQLKKALITSDFGGKYKVYSPQGETEITLKPGESKVLSPDSFKKTQ